MSNRSSEVKPPASPAGRFLRWGAIAVAVVVAAAWLGTWLVQRSFRTSNKKRELQLALEHNLNADIANLGDMTVRINLFRPSRLTFHNTEILHPNVTFEGGMAKIGRMSVLAPPWALARLMPGKLSLQFDNARFSFVQNAFGEWSSDGLMRPLAVGDYRLSLPIPKVSEWEASIRSSRLSLRRRGYELDVGLEGQLFTRAGRKRIAFRSEGGDFIFGRADGEERRRGALGSVELGLIPAEAGEPPLPVAGQCRLAVTGLPVASLPFFLGGIPLDNAPGLFSGAIRYEAHPRAAGALVLDGELSDLPLAVFGLPPHSPLRLTWPVLVEADDLEATVRMGPLGYGAFEISVPLDEDGRPRLLSMRGDVAALDNIPSLFTRYSRWPQWLSRTFPSIEWRTRAWRGFGWNGTNLRLSLVRTTAGLNLTGEAEMLGGRVRIATTPDRADAPINLAAERFDARQMANRMSRYLPEPFRAQITGSHVNLTWRGYPSPDGALDNWGTGMVWAKPVVDLAGSGSWWQALARIPLRIAEALGDWGGGDGGGLGDLARSPEMALDQFSLVAEKENGEIAVEFRAYGGALGQITGIFERLEDGAVEGELLLSGNSVMLGETAKANPSFARALGLLANDTPGLRVTFKMGADGAIIFTHPFLADARKVHESLFGTPEKVP